MKAKNMLPIQRPAFRQQSEDEAVFRELKKSQDAASVDKRNSRIAEVMAVYRSSEMQDATFLLGILHHVDAGHPGYRRLVSACESEGFDWRDVVRFPGTRLSRKPETIAKREAVIVRLRAAGMSYPEIGEVLNTNQSTAREVVERMKRKAVA